MSRRLFYGWVIVATLFVVNFATHATGTLNLGLFVIPMTADMRISRGLFGWLTTVRSLSGGFSGVFIGRALDRFGPRLLIPFSSLVTGLCLIGIGGARNVVYIFVLFSLIGFVGLSTQGGGLLGSVPVAKWFVRRRGTALSLATLGLGVGGVVFLPVTQFLIVGFGWRMAWPILGIMSMALIIPLGLMFLRRQPEDMGLRPDGDTVPLVRSGTPERSEDLEDTWTLRDALGTRAFWLLTTSLALGGFAAGGSIHRIPYWVELGFDPDLVSLSFSADAAGATVMMLAAGFLLDRFPARFVAAGAFAGFAAAVSLMLVATSVVDMFASVVLYGLSVGINLVSQTYLWADYYGRAFLGTIRGITFPTILLATALGGPTVGYIYDFTGGYEPAWQLLVVLYVVAFVIMVSATPPRKKPATRLYQRVTQAR